MDNKKMILWITRTAVFTALLIGAQMATAPLGVTQVTGSLVNLVLVVSVMTCGLPSGMTVALLSPFFAKMFNIGPFWTLVPFIALGNLALVSLWHFICKTRIVNDFVTRCAALVTAAVCKFLILYVAIARIMVPYVLDLPKAQADKISAMFSFSQLLTALIGGAVAMAVLPLVQRALSRKL